MTARPSDNIPHHFEMVADYSGIPVFHRPEDGFREKALANIVQDAFGIDEMLYLGNKSFIDFIGVHGGMAIGGIEFISRNRTFQDLMGRGGVWLKKATLKTARELSVVKISRAWRGVYFFYDMIDGLYWQEVLHMRTEDTKMTDSRGAVASDIEEDGVNIKNLVLLSKWAR